MVSVIAAGELNQPDRALADPWTFKSSLSATEQYNDNVFQSSGPNDPNGPERSDKVTILSPALTISHKTERVTFTVQYQPSVNLYANYNSELNYIGQAGRTSLGVIGLGPGALQDAKLDLSDAFNYTQQSLYNNPLTGEVTGNGGIITQRTTSWSNAASATLAQPLTPTLQGIASYNNTITRYDGPGLTNTNEQGFGLSLKDRVTQRATVSAIYNYTIFNIANERQVTHAISVGMDYAATPTLHTSLTIGDSYLSTNNRQYLTGSASVTKQFHYTFVTASYNNQLTSGGGIVQAPSVTQTADLTLKRTLGPDANAYVAGSYTDQRSSTTPVSVTHSFTTVASADYAVTKWLKATVSYRHSAQQGNDSAAGQDVRWNTIGLTLDGTWETPIP
jgi:hypothetical protein